MRLLLLSSVWSLSVGSVGAAEPPDGMVSTALVALAKPKKSIGDDTSYHLFAPLTLLVR